MPAVSRLVTGSSRIHSVAPASSSRASASRRFWPADSERAGRSPRERMPTRSSAASTSGVGQRLAQAGQEVQVLAGRQVGLEGIEVAEVGHLEVEIVVGAAHDLAAPVDGAALRRAAGRRRSGAAWSCRRRSGPVILRNSPARTPNDTSRRMCRSPRQQLISRASSRAPSGNIDPPRTRIPVSRPEHAAAATKWARSLAKRQSFRVCGLPQRIAFPAARAPPVPPPPLRDHRA